jgi:periplasmic protein TonB
MKTELILQSDVLDIVFENRNKAYGAYYLRKFYNNRLLKSLGAMLLAVVILSAFTFIPNKKKVIYEVGPEILMSHTPITPAEKPKEPEKNKPAEMPAQKAPADVYTVPVIVDNQTPVTPISGLRDSAIVSTAPQDGESGAAALVTPQGTGTGGGGTGDSTYVPEPEPQIDVTVPTDSPDFMPEFPGGMKALKKFLERNLTNPRDMEEDEMISVRVRFVVGYDGKLKSFETVLDGGDEFNKEVIRVLKKMPEWVPGKARGQNVSVYYTIPVKFIPAG